MSQVKIQGNASGTGTFTIAAPNSNTDRTLTLPDNTGSIVLNEGSGTFKIDSAGNVGVGTASPNSAAFGRAIEVSSATSAASIVTSGANSYSWAVSSAEDAFRLFDGTTERLRIDASGNLLVGTTSGTGYRLVVNGTNGVHSTATANQSATYEGVYTGTGTGYFGYWRYGTGVVGSITSTGSTTAYNTSSDYRLKENVQPMQDALAVVEQLNPVTYTWKADGSAGQGFIAHELQAVVPDCVTGEKDAVDEDGNPMYQGVDTSFLVATLTKAIQELKAELDAAKARIAALEGATE